MSSFLNALGRTHRFCVNHLVYPLVLSTLLACGLFAARVYLSHERHLQFLVWNLFLAWIPYLCSLWTVALHRRNPQSWWYLLVPGALWLIFLPNAPYLVTDLLHLGDHPPFPIWYDIGLLAMFAWTGLFLAVVSLNAMQSVVREYMGGIVSWLFAFGAIGLSGFGIYLGRFLSWNSWDVILSPQEIIADIVPRFIHPIRYAQTFGVTILFAAFFLVCYLMFVSIEHRKTEQVEN